jgi:hypothetical protein
MAGLSCAARLLSSELVEKVRRHKADLLAYLRAEQASEPERPSWPEHPRPPRLLRRCGALICQTCHIHSPSPHREGCAFLRFDVCRSRWFWLSPHGAIKCVACTSPADLGLVEGWVLARETGEGDDGYRIPGEILSLLHVASPLQ